VTLDSGARAHHTTRKNRHSCQVHPQRRVNDWRWVGRCHGGEVWSDHATASFLCVGWCMELQARTRGGAALGTGMCGLETTALESASQLTASNLKKRPPHPGCIVGAPSSSTSACESAIFARKRTRPHSQDIQQHHSNPQLILKSGYLHIVLLCSSKATNFLFFSQVFSHVGIDIRYLRLPSHPVVIAQPRSHPTTIRSHYFIPCLFLVSKSSSSCRLLPVRQVHQTYLVPTRHPYLLRRKHHLPGPPCTIRALRHRRIHVWRAVHRVFARH
jgi:hypothetical protein